MTHHPAPTAPGSRARRVERDLLGDRELPAHAYAGIHTLRGAENFPLTGTPVSAHPELVAAIAAVKQAAALAHCDLGVLDAGLGGSIVRACEEIRDGVWHEHFVVDVLQGAPEPQPT